MGKAVEDPKIHIVSFRVTKGEREAIDAARGSQSVSEYVFGAIKRAQGNGR